MRAVFQRVRRAAVRVGGEVAGQIGAGAVILVGVGHGDSLEVAQRLARKCAELRVFADDEGRFNRSLLDTGGSALVVSQFTLMADTRRGRRPGFTDAAAPEIAERLVASFADALQSLGVTVATGRFGAAMEVEFVNDGPVTILLDTTDLERPRPS